MSTEEQSVAIPSNEPPTTAPTSLEAEQAHTTLFSAGVQTRTAVMGTTHTQRSLSSATPFTQPMQQYATEAAWGWIWQRPGLSHAQRSLINIAMLAAMGKSQELSGHVRGGVRNGLSEVEIRETLVQVAGYAGFPTGMEAFRVAEKVLSDMEAAGELPEGYREKKAEDDTQQRQEGH